MLHRCVYTKKLWHKPSQHHTGAHRAKNCYSWNQRSVSLFFLFCRHHHGIRTIHATQLSLARNELHSLQDDCSEPRETPITKDNHHHDTPTAVTITTIRNKQEIHEIASSHIQHAHTYTPGRFEIGCARVQSGQQAAPASPGHGVSIVQWQGCEWAAGERYAQDTAACAKGGEGVMRGSTTF